MKNQEIATTFYQVAQILELLGENSFKIRAYQNGARTIANLTEDIEKVAKQGRLRTLPGIGEGLAKKIKEVLATGDMNYLKKIGSGLPESLFDLLKIPGMGPKKMYTLWKKLGVDNLEKLEAACNIGAVAKLPRFGVKTQKNFLEEIAHLGETSKRRPYEEVLPIALAFLEYIKKQPHVVKVEIAGSLRRKKETVKDIDLLVSAADSGPTSAGDSIMDAVLTYPLVDRIIGQGSKKTSVRFTGGLQVDVRVVADESFACALAYFTGSKDFNVKLRQIALNKGYSLNEYFLRPLDGQPPPIINTEEDLHCKLGFSYIPPENRETAAALS